MDGLLIIDKPAGMTSHDVVTAVRRMAQTRRVGHAGTLDPLATGVLLTLVGFTTRLARFLGGADKTYDAVMRLGVATTTYDADGEVTEEHPLDGVTPAGIAAALGAFRGHIEQEPPMYSAVKVKGQKLYKLARQGKTVAREPRPVDIYGLDVLSWNSPDLTVTVHCSAGTYVRSLAHDLGQALGCGAHLTALRRTSVGVFRLEDAHTLESLGALAAQGRLAEALLPPQAALSGFPVVTLSAEQVTAVRYGQSVAVGRVEEICDHIQGWDAQGRLVAVLVPVEGGVWRPILVFPGEGDNVD